MTRPLVLFPTAEEATLCLGQETGQRNHRSGVELAGAIFDIALIGCGCATSGVLTAHWLQQFQPSRVLLAGAAGSYDLQAHPLASVLSPARVRMHGIGFIKDQQVRPLPFADAPGFQHWQTAGTYSLARPEAQEPAAVTKAASGLDGSHRQATGEILCVATTAPDREIARQRQERFPEAQAEAMEDYGFVLAANLAQKPWTILRGCSNQAGDRDMSRWQVPQAMAAIRDELVVWIRP